MFSLFMKQTLFLPRRRKKSDDDFENIDNLNTIKKKYIDSYWRNPFGNKDDYDDEEDEDDENSEWVEYAPKMQLVIHIRDLFQEVHVNHKNLVRQDLFNLVTCLVQSKEVQFLDLQV